MRLKKVVCNLLMLSTFFPYLAIKNTPFDIQPTALIISLLLLAAHFIKKRDLKIPIEFFGYFLVLFVAVFFAIISKDKLAAARSLFSYVSIAIIPLAIYYSIKYFNKNILTFAVFTNFIVGTIQTFFLKSFGSQILPRLATSFDRGVTGLTVEPSAYAMLNIFYLVFNDLFLFKHRKIYVLNIALCTIQIIYSKSALGFILFAVYIMVKTLMIRRFSKKITAIIVLVFSVVIIVLISEELQLFETSRIGTLLLRLDEGIDNLIFRDGSISDRLLHILVSFKGLFKSYGLGFGLGTWDDYASEIIKGSGEFIQRLASVHFTEGRIMSGWGSAVFELGIFGVVLIINFVVTSYLGIRRQSYNNKELIKTTSITVFVTMLMAVSLSHPLFNVYLGVLSYFKRHKLEDISEERISIKN